MQHNQEIKKELTNKSRSLTTFDKPLGRFPLTKLPQGSRNAVAFYQEQMMWILQGKIPEYMELFIEGQVERWKWGRRPNPWGEGWLCQWPWRTTYGKMVLDKNPGIQQFIREYTVTRERILFKIEASLTITGKKLVCFVPDLDILGHVFWKEGQH
jgi:hypothetical protein